MTLNKVLIKDGLVMHPQKGQKLSPQASLRNPRRLAWGETFFFLFLVNVLRLKENPPQDSAGGCTGQVLFIHKITVKFRLFVA